MYYIKKWLAMFRFRRLLSSGLYSLYKQKYVYLSSYYAFNSYADQVLKSVLTNQNVE